MSTSRAAVTVICDWCQARFSTTRTTTKSARNDAQRKGWRVSRYGPGGQVGASSDPERPDQCPECQPEKHAKPEGGLL